MLKQIIPLLKTLLMKDTDPSELNKPWWQRRRYVHSILAVIGIILYYKWGLVLDNSMQDILSDNYEVISSSVQSLVVAVMAIWGVIGTIVGQRGQTKKLKKALVECQKPQQDDLMQHPALKPDSIPNDVDLKESPK